MTLQQMLALGIGALQAAAPEALRDSLKLLPFLLAVYLVVGWLEYRLGDSIGERLRRAGAAGPLIGALCGCIPQCGFSVMGSALYARRLITLGTLLAVFIATSDEALPVILAQPQRLGVLIPLIGTKVLLALLVGFVADAIVRTRRPAPADPAPVPVHVSSDAHEHEHEHENEHDHGHEHTHEHAHETESLGHEHGCCDHHIAGECAVPARARIYTLLWHPLRHTARVFMYLFLVTLAMGMLIAAYGEERLSLFLQAHLALQPLAAAVFGLIPNCAASVIVTQLFLDGAISFGATVAGLSTGAGVGLMVLLRENPDRRNSAAIVGLLLGISIVAGLLLQYVLPHVAAR